MSNKPRKASSSSSLISLNDVSEMMLPPFLRNPKGPKPELIEHSFRLSRPSDRETRYNLKIKWCEAARTKQEFDHAINMSIRDIQKSHRSASAPILSPRATKPEPQYISIGGIDSSAAAEKKHPKVVVRSLAQVRRDGNIVRMLFRDEHGQAATLADIVNTVIQQLDAVGTRPDVYLLSSENDLVRPNKTLRYESLPSWQLADMVKDLTREVHVAIDFSYELAKTKAK